MTKIILYLSLFLVIACQSSPQYDVGGVITNIFPERHELEIHHDEIPGFMMAMTMNFKLGPNTEIDQFSVGDSVHFKLILEENSAYADKFKIVGYVEINKPENDFWDEDDPYAPLDYGDTLTDVTFTEMSGKTVKISDSDGKFRFISFIFSRCPMPNMCPALLFKQRYLAEELAGENIEIIMISFDYVFDTPEVLNLIYGATFADHDNWQMWSSAGHLNDMHMISKQSMFGFWGVAENDIGHNMRCLLLDPDRRMIKTFDGLDWLPKDAKSDILALIKTYSN